MTKFAVEENENRWGSWHKLAWILAHSLSDTVTASGFVPKNMHQKYITAIIWANQWCDSSDRACTPEYDADERCQLRTVPKGEISCLEQDIFTAIFTIHEMQSGIFELEKSDDEILSPVLKHLHTLVPWIKWID